MKPSTNYVWTYVEVGGEELEPVQVWYDSSPPEPDVNWPGGFEVECVEHQGKDITGNISDAELESLRIRVLDDLTAQAEDYRY